MGIMISPELETRLRAQAQTEGVSVEVYIERLVDSEERAKEELSSAALEGLDSGEPLEGNAAYWEEKHRQLDERLKRA